LVGRISGAAGLPPSGIIANGNLGAQTGFADVTAGLHHARQLEGLLGIPTWLVCCPRPLIDECRQAVEGLPVMGLSFYMRPVWEASSDR
jgi:hypothetical protein